ncbi:hypothetical protein FRB94_014380 [Tulasnella sp. JGI-2019a]|nr:hypothetical protein FRB93_008170 [Tulasnella sp. JGI-2019a]KAG8989462.1 hypothetical protein FRB94_014380 [Tulasnella sp. JGI-2019a]KAG9022758.1 hypothetical protein FRB95_014208 [Tulasnella sp. JGI-2019a]
MEAPALTVKVPDHLSLQDDDVQINRFDGLGARLKKIEYLLNQLRNFCIAEPGVSSEKKVQIERAVTRFTAIASIEEVPGYNRFFGSNAVARRSAAELLKDLHLIRKQLRRAYTSRTISQALQRPSKPFKLSAMAWPDYRTQVPIARCSFDDQPSIHTSSLFSQESDSALNSLRYVPSLLFIPNTAESAVQCDILLDETAQSEYISPRFIEHFDTSSASSSDSEFDL